MLLIPSISDYLLDCIEIRGPPLTKAQARYAELWGKSCGLFEEREHGVIFFTDGFGNALAQELANFPNDQMRACRSAVAKFLRVGTRPGDQEILVRYVYIIVNGMQRK